MELQQFVTESIKQIVHGVADAQSACGSTNARINPVGLTYQRADADSLYWDAESGRVAERVEFDVAVSTVDEKGTKGGAGIFVGPVALGTQGASGTSSTSCSRIKFATFVILPSPEVKEESQPEN